MKKFFLIKLLASLVVSGAIGIIILLIGDFNETQRKMLFTALAVGAFSLTGLASGSRPSSLLLWPIPLLGIVASVAALAVIILRIWDRMDILAFRSLTQYADWERKLVITTLVLAVSLAHMSLLAALEPANSMVSYCRGAALLAVAAMGALLIGVVLQGIDVHSEGFYYRLLGVVAILDVLGTASLSILARLAIVPKPASAHGLSRGEEVHQRGKARKTPRRA